MCSVNDTDFEDSLQCMEKKSNVTCGSLCKKCNENPSDIVLRIRDVYCRDCFLAASTHKFRACLGKSKLIRPKDHVLIAFSGSQSSVALLHLIQAGLQGTSHKRLLFTSSVLYIDEGAVLGWSREERQSTTSAVIKKINQFNFPAYVTTLDKALDDIGTTIRIGINSWPITSDDQDQVHGLFHNVKTLTGKEDLLQKLRNKLLLKVANQLKCSKIFIAETETDLAVKLLSNVSLGRGAQLPLDIGFCDTRDPNIKLVRPMRDFMRKEIAYYNVFNKLEPSYIPTLGTKASCYASIQKLTEKFVVDLQEDFPSTVSTVFRTGDKLSMATNSIEEDELCVLCQAPLDTSSVESSALQATEFSRMVSVLGPKGFDSHSIGVLSKINPKLETPKSDCDSRTHTPQNLQRTANDDKMCMTEHNLNNDVSVEANDSQVTNEKKYYGRGSCSCNKTFSEKESLNLTFEEAKSVLCYGCRLIAREMESLEHLSLGVRSAIEKRSRYKQMRQEIEDFLL